MLAAIGYLLLNMNHIIIDGSASRVLASSALVAEALAVRNACLVGTIRELQRLIICSDPKMLISLVSLDLEPPWKIETNIKDIHSIVGPLGFDFTFIPRNLNRLANCIVKLALGNELPCNWVSMAPTKVRSLLERLV